MSEVREQDDYVKRQQEIEELKQLRADNKRLESLCDGLQLQIDNFQQTMIDCIQENNSLPVVYIVSVNNSLAIVKNLRRMIAYSLREIHRIVGIESNEYIFDTNEYFMFHEDPNGELYIGKNFKLDIDGMEYDEAVFKLQKMAKNFDNIHILCKRIGSEVNIITKARAIEDYKDTIDKLAYNGRLSTESGEVYESLSFEHLKSEEYISENGKPDLGGILEIIDAAEERAHEDVERIKAEEAEEEASNKKKKKKRVFGKVRKGDEEEGDADLLNGVDDEAGEEEESDDEGYEDTEEDVDLEEEEEAEQKSKKKFRLFGKK